jgi:hypothetical protein
MRYRSLWNTEFGYVFHSVELFCTPPPPCIQYFTQTFEIPSKSARLQAKTNIFK